MSYLDQRGAMRRPEVVAAVAVVHVALGYALLSGLAVKFVPSLPVPNTKTTDVRLTPPPEPTPEPLPTASASAKVQPAAPKVFTPPQPYAQPSAPAVDGSLTPVEDFPVVLPSATPGLNQPLVSDPTPTPQPSFVATGAAPANDPGRWVTNADYRSSWINQELVGTARFRLDIAADGRVTGCRITGSTGHAALDEATCRLVSKRARFKPARDANGDAVASSYVQTVKWQLPD